MAGRRSKKDSYCHNKIEWRVAGYFRLSREDGDNDESDSIKNQRDLVTYYLKKESNLKSIDYYIDDGYSGTSFKRPSFKRMVNDIMNGKINTIIIKDLSRLGRNYIEVGKYLEEIFPSYNVRIISVNDNVDSYKDPKSLNNVLVAFKNLLNDEYARDISIKVRSSYNTKAKNGEFVGGTTPYGYKKDPNDIHHLIIDDDEVDVVKLIFQKALEGEGKIKICKYLNNNNILCRKELQRRKKRNLSLIPEEEEIVYRWSTSTIGRLLANESYIGNVVQNKSSTMSYKVHKVICKPKEEWIVVKNKHEAIIEKEVFDKVQELTKERDTKKKKATNYSIYKGKLKCADCGKAMYRVEDFRRGRNVSNYYCGSYQNITNTCTPHKIKTSILDNTVLEVIILQVKMVLNLEKALNKLQTEKANDTFGKEYEKNIKNINNKIDEIKSLKKQAYEEWKFQKITKDEFLIISKEYETNLESISNQKEVMEKMYFENLNNQKKDDYWIEHFRRNKKIRILTKDILDELIETIYVHNDENITIKFKYQDEYQSAINLLRNNGEQINE